jgi:glutathione S-transferase
MDYLAPEQARDMPGVRVALTVRAFGPWGQAVKKMLEYKSIPYVAVAQYAGEPNDALVQWTGTRNAPTLVHDDNPPLTRWLDQIAFVESHKPHPALLPKDSESRIVVLGLIHELAGEWGFGWCRRLMLLDDAAAAKKIAAEASPAGFKLIMNQYGFNPLSVAAAPERIVDILETLTKRLKAQQRRGSPFLVGSVLTAADIYWACFSSMLEPLPDELCPMPPEMRQNRMPRDPRILPAKDPILLEHRNAMFAKHLGPCAF